MEATKNKKDSHTSFRNEELFCYNCGRSMKMPLPMTSGMFSAIIKEFNKEHKHCEKTWVEPVAETNVKTLKQNMDWWMSHGEHGTSSKTMFSILSGNRIAKYLSTPCDPDDFRRCYLLLKAIPQWKSELHKLKDHGEVWSKLVDNWNILTTMLEAAMKTKDGRAPEMYELMKSIGC